jgi:exopolyphosphatase / guanosine-5'-triphosphate,3'-diphosphate pyrophosphatase
MNNFRASIDIGSNSVLLLAGKYQDNVFEELLNESWVTGLGRGLDQTGNFSAEAMEQTKLCLREYAHLLKSYDYKLHDTIVTATEAARVAKNATAFFEEIQNEIGFSVKIITGEAEAYFSAKGILFNTNFNENKIIVMDIGGASTEIIEVDTIKQFPIRSFSMPMGAVRLTNWREDLSYEQKLMKIFDDFSTQLMTMKTKKLYCVAGTMTSVANMYLNHKDFQEKKIHGLQFSANIVHQMIDKYRSFNSDDFQRDFPFLNKRSKTIYGGLIVASTVINWLGVESLQISTYGLRYGTLLQGGIPNEYLA